MNRAKSLAVVSALLVLALVLGSCGGSSTGFNPADGNAGFIGISEGGFKAVRYNDAGHQDSSLNGSMDLKVREEGGLTVVSVAIEDEAASLGVMLDLGYDPARYTPVDVDFAGLVDSPLELAVTSVAGTVGLGQVGDRRTAVHRGSFVSVSFSHTPFARGVSAQGGAYSLDPVDTAYPSFAGNPEQPGFVLTDSSAGDGDDITFDVFAIFAAGDGNSDSQTLVSDLATIGQIGTQRSVSDTDLVPAIADFNRDGAVSIQDLTPIGLNFQRGYTDIEVLVGDDADFDETDTAVLTLAFAESTAPTTDYDTANLDYKQIFRNWSGSITPEQAAAADANQDGEVFISARAIDTNGPTGAQSGPAFSGIPVEVGPTIPALVSVTDFELEINGATGGTGTEGRIFVDGSEATVIANSGVTINVLSISGNYDGTPFGPGDIDTVIPGDVYDTALDAVRGLVVLDSQNAGAAGAEFTGPVLDLSATSGVDVTAVVTPDDDPESMDASAEGIFNASLAASASVPTEISKTVAIDVETDPDAPLYASLNSPEGQDGNNNWLFSAVQNTLVSVNFQFGATGAPSNFDGASLHGELYDLDNGVSVPLTYMDPIEDPLQFRVRDAGDPNFAIEVLVSPSSLVAGHRYAIRLDPAPGNFNSINKPGEFFALGDLPPSQELRILPGSDIDAGVDTITLFYADPVMRRNSKVVIDLELNVTPQFPGAFDDVLKSSGDEFGWQAPDNGGPWPQITIVEAADASGIDANTIGIEGVIELFTDSHTGYIGVDIAALPDPIGDEDITYSFKLFSKPVTPGDPGTRPEIGFGSFTVHGLSLGDGPIAGVDFGIDIFDDAGRGDLGLEAMDFSGKTLNLATLQNLNDAGMPDVLWVQWAGGRVRLPEDNNNVRVIATDADGVIGSQTLDLEVRAVGLGLDGLDFLGTYQFSNTDKLMTGVGGIFAGGVNYELVLSDGVATDFAFASPLAVTE